MNFEISGKVAVVTGGARGIGRACALSLAREGVHICLADTNPEEAAVTARDLEELGVRALTVECDVSEQEAVGELFARCAKELGTVDILVNNAGISPKHRFQEIAPEEFELVTRVNLLGGFLCAQEAFRQMKDKGWGRIIGVSSMAGIFGANQAGVHYAATKAGMIAMAKTLAKEFGAYNITVNTVAPGRIKGALTDELPPEVQEEITARIPLGRFGETSEVADVVAFLSSRQAGYITGACVEILGGFIA